jgi:phosphatidylglycerophosphate synthase
VTRPDPVRFFKDSLKSDAYYSDEFINIYLLRPVAAFIVWLLYPTGVTPNQVTIAAIIAGFAAAWAYLGNTPGWFVVAGVLVTMKDLLDDADGQLARAKQLYSRRGRFLDSIGDAAVDCALFFAITIAVLQSHHSFLIVLLGVLSLIGLTLRVSYHVYYQASFLHLEKSYSLNRIIEEVTEEDRKGDPVALRLQQTFNVIYTWQDKLIAQIDNACKGRGFNENETREWYRDKAGLRISGLLGFGTELALLSLCSILNRLELYLWLNVLVMNGICLAAIAYRKFALSPRIARQSEAPK